MPIQIYGGPRSPNSRKVMILAAELGIPFESIQPDFAGQRSPEYLAMNPNGKVPTLVDDGFVLWESNAILRYLVHKQGDRKLLPDDPRQHAKVDQWLFWWTSHPEPALYSLVVQRLVKPFLKQEPDLGVERAAEADLDRFLPILENQLAGKEYVLGGLSIVDFGIAPWIEAAPRIRVDMGRYPGVMAWLARMQARASWKGG
jgi:glutathione S-transferase